MTAFVPHRVGLYLAVVQFFFAITWTVYVIFLPRLAAETGIPRQMVIFILMMDQLIFVLMSAVTSALDFGHGGREGRITGTVFALLALAAFARTAVLAAQLNKDPQFAALLEWMPVLIWALAGVLLLLLVPMQRRAPA